MKTIIAAFRELWGLFVDDGSLALGLIAVIAFAATSLALEPDYFLLAGAILLFGCIGALLENVARAARPPAR